jgi:hypothetical protein
MGKKNPVSETLCSLVIFGIPDEGQNPEAQYFQVCTARQQGPTNSLKVKDVGIHSHVPSFLMVS